METFGSRYGLFLAQTLTLLVALVIAVAVVLALVGAAVGRRGQGGRGSRARVEVKNLNQRYEDLAVALRTGLLPPRAAKKQRKEHRRRRKQLAKQDQPAATAGPDGGPDGAGKASPRLFVLDFRGDVRASQVRTLREEVTTLLSVATSDDEVVVRLDNPGGFVHDQGLAAAQLLRLRERGIPLTVCVDKVAASGGYMMACVADRILAAPFAVVGSIGVIAQLPNFHRLLDRHGVDYEQVTGGEYKRTVTMFGETTDEDRRKLTEEIEDLHGLFKDFVAEHRPQVDIARVGTGEAWYGRRALELRLVDELVTSDDYLLAARERAQVYEVSYVPGRPVRSALGSWRNALRSLLPPA